MALTKKYFGDWKRGSYVPDIPAEPPQTEPRTASVEWNSPTLPWIAVAFKAPAYSDEKKDKAALDLLSPIAFGPNSELYQRLVLKEQKVDELQPDFGNHPDPELFTIYARVKDPKDIDYVRDQILATFKRFTKEPVDQAKLDATRSRIRYSFALRMNSSSAIANALAPYIGLRRTPETINKLFALYQQITPQDIQSDRKPVFHAEQSHDRDAHQQGGNETSRSKQDRQSQFSALVGSALGRRSRRSRARLGERACCPARSPLVTFRILFTTVRPSILRARKVSPH